MSIASTLIFYQRGFGPSHLAGPLIHEMKCKYVVLIKYKIIRGLGYTFIEFDINS